MSVGACLVRYTYNGIEIVIGKFMHVSGGMYMNNGIVIGKSLYLLHTSSLS